MPDERDRDGGYGRCVVCGGEAAGVASSALGPVSFPYCSTCIEEDADDVGMLVGRIVRAGGLEHVEPWVVRMIEPSIRRSGMRPLEFVMALLGRLERVDWSVLTAHRDLEDRVRGGLWGLVVGDALGVPAQFRDRAEVRADPVEGMRPLGDLPPGTWSDDGSMALQLAASLAERGYDPHDIMERFWRWYEHGEMTPFGRAWDIGGRTQTAMEAYRSKRPELGGEDAGEWDNGNGSLMRNLPLAIFLAGEERDTVVRSSFEVSALTHAHIRARLCCAYHSLLVRALLQGWVFERAMRVASELIEPYVPAKERLVLGPILEGTIVDFPEDEIESTGYVVHTLGASLWCLARHDRYPDAVLEAVNLGDDADTTAAVTGGLAGVRGGMEEIPGRWVEALQASRKVGEVVDRFVGRSFGRL